MAGLVIICAVVVLVGLVGIVVPVLPGTVLVALGIGIWASAQRTAGGWAVFATSTAFLVTGAVVKYAVPGRRLKSSVPTGTLLAGALGAVVGFFVIPVVGALAGFPLGVYIAERRRLGPEGARASTRAALRAVGVGILIELVAALAATAVWAIGVVAT